MYSTTTAELFWDRSTDDGFVQGYEIIRNGESLGIVDALSQFQEGLDPATTYNYQVTAIDTDGNRSEMATITVTTGDGGGSPPTGTAPSIPGNLRHDVYSSTTAELFWDRSTDDGLVQGYEIVRNGESLGVFDALSQFEDGLDPADVYTYQVFAIDSDGNRSAAATITVSTGDSDGSTPSEGRPATPANFRHLVYSQTSAEIFWNRSTDDGLVQGYEILRNDETLGVFDSLSLFQNQLDPEVTYLYTITAIDNEGNRSSSDSIVVKTVGSGSTPPANNGPSTPRNLRRQVYSTSTAEVFWDRSTHDGLIQGYDVVRNGNSLGILDALSVFQQGLDPAVTYTYVVTAVGTDGSRSESTSISVSTASDGNNPPSDNGPGIPGNLRHQVYSATALEIFWDRSTYDGVIQGYEIVRNGESLGIRDALEVFQPGLEPAASYTYTVTAIGSDGSRSATATISVSTKNQ